MFKDEIKRLRIAYRCTQDKMALLCEVPSSTYKNWELGNNLPNIENFDKLQQLAQKVWKYNDKDKLTKFINAFEEGKIK